jgi:succinate dehydrogenase / fumarate reductase iron-sulfur subunit
MELVDSLPVITKALLRRKITAGKAIFGHKIPKDDLKQVRRIYDTVEGHDERYELNLYITGYDEDETGAEAGPASAGTDGSGQAGAEAGQPGQEPEESPTR